MYVYIYIYLLECISYICTCNIFQMGLQGEIDKVAHLKQVVPTDLLKLLSFHLSCFVQGISYLNHWSMILVGYSLR